SKIIEKTEKEEATLSKKSEKFRKVIESRLLIAYNNIRKRYRNGLAVVPIKRNACGGCFNQVPPQVQLEIGLRKKIIACEHCGRVLVDDQIMEVEG
ncbi:MAG: C4-type zinc ribbon domain-containing protein, partial [Saprospiraceae bacterium]